MWCSKIAVNNTIYSVLNMWCSKLRRNRMGNGLVRDGLWAFPIGEFDKMDG